MVLNPKRECSQTINYQLKSLSTCSQLPRPLHVHRRAVAQHLAYARADLRRVVTDADDRVGAQLAGMADHLVERVLARPLAQRRVERDVPAKQALDMRAEIAHNRAGAHDNTAHYPERLGHSVTGQL